jgi:signal transduction histidine kinase
LVKLDGSLNNNQNSYVQKIDQVIEQGQKLITDLLAVNQVVETDLQKSKINIAELFHSLEQEFDPQASEKNIKLSFASEGHPTFVSAKDNIFRILDNLISNAIKYSPAGRHVFISADVRNDSVIFRVKDEGPGFTEEDQKRMFKKFQRLSAQPTGGESSNGLGLAIVKKLCDELNATIQLRNQIPKGVEFIIEIPVSR